MVMRNRHVRTALGALVLSLSFSLAVVAGRQPARYLDRGLALSGYDAVAYFTESRAVKGSPEFEVPWDGARWRFVSAANRDRFLREPARFAPQFGGYCAYAVSQGHTATADPEAWSVVDGALYVNYSPSVKKTWEKDIAGYIRQAKANWPGVLDK
jgi:hypothetical protein